MLKNSDLNPFTPLDIILFPLFQIQDCACMIQMQRIAGKFKLALNNVRSENKTEDTG